MKDIAHELFGEMRYLTSEENARKRNMYRKMSTTVDEVEFAKKPKYCEGVECESCYRYLQCWACKKADVENNRTCGKKLQMKIGAKAYNAQKIDCFECDISEVIDND